MSTPVIAPPPTTREPLGRARRMWQSRSHVLVDDVLYFSGGVPRYPVDRLMPLADLVELRQSSPQRISWTVLFLKAFGLVAADTPALRRVYARWPWGHLIEMPLSVGMVAINRRDADRNEDRLCWGRFIRPEQQSLVELQRALEQYQADPIDEAFRRQAELSRMPLPLRRLIWWWNLNFAGLKRATRLGTFSVSTLAGQGAWNRFHPTIQTSSLSFGPLDDNSQSLVTLICDHRVIDGTPAARALADLEAALMGPVAQELAALAS